MDILILAGIIGWVLVRLKEHKKAGPRKYRNKG